MSARKQPYGGQPRDSIYVHINTIFRTYTKHKASPLVSHIAPVNYVIFFLLRADFRLFLSRLLTHTHIERDFPNERECAAHIYVAVFRWLIRARTQKHLAPHVARGCVNEFN